VHEEIVRILSFVPRARMNGLVRKTAYRLSFVLSSNLYSCFSADRARPHGWCPPIQRSSLHSQLSSRETGRSILLFSLRLILEQN